MFDPPSLENMNFLDGFKVAKILKGLRTSFGEIPKNADELPIHQVIDRFEKAHQKNPKDWFICNQLGSLYLSTKQYGKSVEILKKGLDLRYNDIRSTYALATAYRQLTRAQFIGNPLDQICPDYHDRQKLINGGFDPETSNRELQKLGLTLDEVAEKSMLLFEKTLRLGVRKNERPLIYESLQKMYSDFPHLELQVKNQIKPKYNNVVDPSGSGNLLNEAIARYSRLRYLLDSPPRYRFELGEVIRLCHWAITVDKRNGDLFVLLANAYSILDTCVQSSMTDHAFYKRWAGAIIQYWIDSPLKQFPYTKNIKIGEALYESILKEFMFTHNASRETIIPLMKTMTEDYLDIAISPTSYEKIKNQLNSEPI